MAPFGDMPEAIRQTLFLKTAVIPSIEQGLIPYPEKLIVSADGTKVISHATPHGRELGTEP